MFKKIKSWLFPQTGIYENKLVTATEVVSVEKEVKKVKKAPAKKKTVAKKPVKKAPVKKGNKSTKKSGGGGKPQQAL